MDFLYMTEKRTRPLYCAYEGDCDLYERLIVGYVNFDDAFPPFSDVVPFRLAACDRATLRIAVGRSLATTSILYTSTMLSIRDGDRSSANTE